MINSRRDFLLASSLSLGSFIVSTALSGCGDNDIGDPVRQDITPDIDFLHGVASGDPLTHSIILWTKVTPQKDQAVISVLYEVATDILFKSLVRPAQSAYTYQLTNYTLKIDFEGLEPNTNYYYRFRVGQKVSPIGKTKTLPEDHLDSAKFLIFSSANYSDGNFNVYKDALEIPNIDASIYLGDYIFETAAVADDYRALPKEGTDELLSLDDYRRRYALYRQDKNLQALHAAHPMIVLWNDHEIATGAYKDGAKGHDDDEGDYTDRQRAALQAYFEWLPIRPYSEYNIAVITRTFTYGNLLNLQTLDTRVVGKEKPLDYNDFKELSLGHTEAFTTAMSDPERSILGPTQTQVIQANMQQSTTKWEVLAQPLLMGRILFPVELFKLIVQLSDAKEESMRTQILDALKTSLEELYFIKLAIKFNDPVSNEDRLRLSTVLPYNLEAWDGYLVNREIIFATANALNKNLVVLSADTHNAWANELKMFDENQEPSIRVGVEFATASVSAKGMEAFTKITDNVEAQAFEDSIVEIIDDLKYFNSKDRGFMSVHFTQEEVTTQWHYINTVIAPNYYKLSSRSKELKCVAGTHTLATI